MGKGKPRIALWGAFDASDFCDRLSPLIVEQQLSGRLGDLEMACFAPAGGAAVAPGGPPCFPLAPNGGYLPPERRRYFAGNFDAVLIGGGDLLRFDRVAPDHDRSGREGPPLRPYHAFLEPFWDEERPTILWNAPGVPSRFERPRRPLVRRACSCVDYLCVRDEASRQHLVEAGVEGPVHVVPDTGVLIAELVRSRGPDGRELLLERGVGAGGRRVLLFQSSPAACAGEEGLVARTLTRVADANDLEVVLIPLGPEDRGPLRSIRQAGGGRFVLLEEAGSPIETAAMIGACDFFAGSSLPGNLTALSFGTPHLVANTRRLDGPEGFVQLAGLEDFRLTSWSDLGDALGRLVLAAPDRWSEAGGRLKAPAAAHFDRLAGLISEAAERRENPQERASGRPAADPKERELAEAHGEIAVLLDRLDDERHGAEVGRSRFSSHRATEDGGELERLRRQLADRERTILDLGRELRNLEELRATLRDRTEQLARRDREVELLTHRLTVRNHMTALRIGGQAPEDRTPEGGTGA